MNSNSMYVIHAITITIIKLKILYNNVKQMNKTILLLYMFSLKHKPFYSKSYLLTID